MLLYADDLVIYKPIDRANALGKNDVSIFQNDLRSIYKWCQNSQLTINLKKTKYIYFSVHNLKHPQK